METYKAALKIKAFLLQKLESFFNEYIERYSKNIGYLQFYPLILIEDLYLANEHNPEKVSDKMYELSWFIASIRKRIKTSQLEHDIFVFNINDYNKFQKEYSEEISKNYWVYREIMTKLDDIYSPVSLSLESEANSNKYKMIWPLISSPINSEAIYFYNAFNKKELEYGKKIKSEPIEYIMSKFMANKFDDLYKGFDEKLYALCMKCVAIDIDKLGGSIKSKSIKSSEDLKRFVGYFYYKSLVHKVFNSIKNPFVISNPSENLIQVSKNELLLNLYEVTGLSEGKIDKLLEYFTFKDSGSFNEFPFIEDNDLIYWSPFAWILNDFQFSIVNGHYFKNIVFQNRDKTISHSLVANIDSKFNEYNNLKVEKEYYYEYFLNGQKINSDIDVAILDEKNKALLIIECKWKDNFYAIAGQQVITKVFRGVQKIYSDQISKHRGFFENNSDAVKNIFKDTKLKREEIKIHYIVVDKRSQLFIDDFELVPVYGLLYLAEVKGKGDYLNLRGLIDAINSFQTSIEYICNDPKVYKIDEEIILLSEDLE